MYLEKIIFVYKIADFNDYDNKYLNHQLQMNNVYSDSKSVTSQFITCNVSFELLKIYRIKNSTNILTNIQMRTLTQTLAQ